MSWIRFTTVLAAVLGVCTASVASECCNPEFTTQNYLEQVLLNYRDVWNGNLSLVDATFSPALSLRADRFPQSSGQGTREIGSLVNSSASFAFFVQQTRSSFEVYNFTMNKWAGYGNQVVGRWTMDGIIGQNFLLPT